MSVDRPSLQYAASELAEGMSKPLEIHWLRLKRIGKYIAKYPVEKWHFEYQEAPKVLEGFSDSDWATNRWNRRSVSSTFQRFGKRLIDSCCGRQSLIALSSGEAEFYAMVKTAAEGKLTKAILEHFGWEVKHRVLSDSSAARSIAQRVGCGKVQHLSLKQMWLQQAVREKELEIGKVDTLLNLADLGTKALEPSRMDSLMKQLLLERGLLATLLIGSITMAQAHQDAMESRLDQLTSWYPFTVHFFALVGLVWFTVKSSGLVLKGCGRLFGIGMGEAPESCLAVLALALAFFAFLAPLRGCTNVHWCRGAFQVLLGPGDLEDFFPHLGPLVQSSRVPHEVLFDTRVCNTQDHDTDDCLVIDILARLLFVLAHLSLKGLYASNQVSLELVPKDLQEKADVSCL